MSILKTRSLALLAVLFCVLMLGLSTSCLRGNGNFFPEEADDDATDDDAADDDTSDDDASDDDAADDDSAAVTVTPLDGATEVPVSTTVQLDVSDDDTFDPATLNFALKNGPVTIDGVGQFSADNKYFAFYPAGLLAPNTDYATTFTYNGSTLHTQFTTVASTGDTPITGNAQAAPGALVMFQIVFDSLIQPPGLDSIILPILNDSLVILAPIFLGTVGKDQTAMTWDIGTAKDFDSDSFLEQNHSIYTAGGNKDGLIDGNDFNVSGALDVILDAGTVHLDLAHFSGVLGLSGGDPVITDANFTAATTDCAGLEAAFPDYATIIEEVCAAGSGTIYLTATCHGEFQAVKDATVSLTGAGADAIEINVDPDLNTSSAFPNPGHARFDIYQGSTLVLSSLDYPDQVSFPECTAGCPQAGPSWYTFSDILFAIPSGHELASGDYTLRAVMGVYGAQVDFTVP